MKEETTKYWELLIKLNDGSIKAEELADLETWKENNIDTFQEFEKILQATEVHGQTPAFDPQENWHELQTMIKINAESASGKTVRIFPWLVRVAAAIIMVIGLTYIFYYYPSTTKESLVLQTMVSTDISTQKTVVLPDGSIVSLNRNSELLYPETFDSDSRTIYLKGEAFFEVAPNKDKPFMIYSGSTKTTVLGTSFNLRAYSKEDEVKLTVVTGKVAFTLADDKEGVIVTPGNMGMLVNSTKQIASGVNTDLNFLSWKTKQLSFNGNALSELIESLEKHYDAQIVIDEDATGLCTFTGDFSETDLENALRIITKATGTSFRFADGQYIIMGKGCN